MNNSSRSMLARLNRLTYSQKFSLITLLFTLPLIAFIPLFVNQYTRIDQYGYKEFSGTLYLRPVWQLTEDFQNYVTLTQKFSQNKIQLAEVQTAQATVDKDFGVLQQTHAEYRDQLLPGETLDTLNQQWQGIKVAVQSSDWRNFETQQVQLLKSLSSWTARVGDSSSLILDPDLDTYYLMDAVLLKLPENQSLLFQILQTSQDALDQGSLSAEDRAQLIILTGRIAANLQAMQRNLKVAIQNDQTNALNRTISTPLAKYQNTSQSFVDFINTELNKPTTASDLESQIAAHYQVADQAESIFYPIASQALAAGVNHRTSTLSIQLYAALAIALVSILIAFLIGRSTMRSISVPLSQLFEAAGQVAAGKMSTRVSVNQGSEIGQVASAFNNMAIELERDKAALLARTTDLNLARMQSEKRTQTLQTISEISRVISDEQNFKTLLSLIPRVISEKLQFHHCAIFLVDSNREFAILQAASSSSGRQILEHGLKFELGGNGEIESVVMKGNPHFASDENALPSYLNEYERLKIHSRVVLPIKLAGIVIGVLDIQSPENNLFHPDDIDVLVTLTDQIAITLQNAQSFEQAQSALREVESSSRQVTLQAWEAYLENVQVRGYRYDGIKPEAIKESKPVTDEKSNFYFPVKLRGQTIGRLKFKLTDPYRTWTEDERAIIEATADRVALALDGARLLDEAQKRASRETLLSTIGAKLGASFQFDSILRDTVEELGLALKGSTVSFQLVNPSAPPTIKANGGNGSSPDSERDEHES